VLVLRLLLLLALLAAAGNAKAHLADSYLRIEIGAAGAIGGQWDIALRDLDDVAVGLDADQDGASFGRGSGRSKPMPSGASRSPATVSSAG